MIEILNNFERHLIEDGKRPKTIESYVGYVKGIIEYLNEINVTFDGILSRFQLQKQIARKRLRTNYHQQKD